MLFSGKDVAKCIAAVVAGIPGHALSFILDLLFSDAHNTDGSSCCFANKLRHCLQQNTARCAGIGTHVASTNVTARYLGSLTEFVTFNISSNCHQPSLVKPKGKQCDKRFSLLAQFLRCQTMTRRLTKAKKKKRNRSSTARCDQRLRKLSTICATNPFCQGSSMLERLKNSTLRLFRSIYCYCSMQGTSGDEQFHRSKNNYIPRTGGHWNLRHLQHLHDIHRVMFNCSVRPEYVTCLVFRYSLF